MRLTIMLGAFATFGVACSSKPEPVYLRSRVRPAQAAERAAPTKTAPVRVEPPTSSPAEPSGRGIAAPPDVYAIPEDAERSESGLAWRVLRQGGGELRPTPRDGVSVHYTGWRAEDGEMFDSSVARGSPVDFPLHRVIEGWTEGLQLMVEGEERRFWIPERLAYHGRRGPQGMLVFDIELLEVFRVPDPPEHVAAPPREAERTDSGLATIVLEEGEGDRHPGLDDEVEVHYAGWRAENGELFDSSYGRRQASRFGVARVIEGWREGLRLMVAGERRLLWIPAELAYEGRPGPQGMLVFDVTLRRIL